MDLQQLKILAQLIDNMNISAAGMEKYYNKKNSEKFNLAKKEILDINEKISGIIS